jgi:ElaB/YqjD/DUF883 family membrane-anchored ribosome-binding protein
MSSSAQLEHEAEQTRSELARTLDELRGRMSPGQLVDQAVDYAQDTTGGEFFRNLSRQVAANPLPVALISAGIGWLALARGNSRAGSSRVTSGFGTASDSAQARMSEWSAQAGDTASAAANQAADTAGSWSDSVSDASGRATSAMTDAGSAMSESAASAYDSMRSSASNAASSAADAYGRFADAASRTGSAMAQSASGAGQKMAGFGTDALAFCREQPLVLAGLGLAIGAVLGAVIPSTDTEDRLMGDASDRLKDQARGAAGEQIEKVKTAVQGGMEQAPAQAEHLANSLGEAATTTLVPQDHDAEHRDAEPRDAEHRGAEPRDAEARLPLE